MSTYKSLSFFKSYCPCMIMGVLCIIDSTPGYFSCLFSGCECRLPSCCPPCATEVAERNPPSHQNDESKKAEETFITHVQRKQGIRIQFIGFDRADDDRRQQWNNQRNKTR